MHHGASLIYTIAAALGMALIFGFLAARLRLPALVGYLLAGVIIGPYTPGFVADPDIAAQLAEIGVMLLMFGVGLHFSFDDLLAVRKIALPGAIVQIGAATLMGVGLSMWWGWSLGAALVFGLALSVASTVVLLRALETLGILDTHTGRIAIGWLVVEDLAMVLVLVLLPPLAGLLGGQAEGGEVVDASDVWRTLGITLLQVGGFVLLMLVVGRRLFPWLLWQVTRTGSRELFTLCVVAAAVSIAYASSALFGVSFALGAFFAGMVMRESEFSHRAAEESLPLRDAFAVLFFVSVGMLFNPTVLLERPLQVLAVVLVIVVGKSFAACALVLAFRYPLATALTVSASLAQIGEFSFILIALGLKYQMMPPEAQSLVLAGALISIAINPLCFRGIQPILAWLQRHSAFARRMEARDDPLAELPMSTEARYLSRQVVLVGYGRVGRRIARELRANDIPFVIADQNRELIERLREKGAAAVWGDAAEPAVLIQAHIARAHVLVVAIADALNVRQMIETARTLNPEIQIVVRSHNEAEAELLAKEAQATVFLGEQELAQAMARDVLQRATTPAPVSAPLLDLKLC
ncbi:MAG: Kef family K(+) transporter [Comamonadaceae bacterium]|nr:MAG: Kef family K(+) transporter [Comamonadaceae bacterium]